MRSGAVCVECRVIAIVAVARGMFLITQKCGSDNVQHIIDTDTTCADFESDSDAHRKRYGVQLVLPYF